jgi:hypothetical protein
MLFEDTAQSPAKLLADCVNSKELSKKFQPEPCIYLRAGLYSTPKLR